MTTDLRKLLDLAERADGAAGAAQEELEAAASAHVRDLLHGGGEPAEILPFLNAHLNELAAQPESDPAAVERLRQVLLARFDLQANRNRTRRLILAAIPSGLVAVLVVAYFTWRFVNLLPLDQAIETREGLKQRAAAVQKVLYYDSWHLDEVPSERAHTLLEVALWPIAPTAEEIEGAKEFVAASARGGKLTGCWIATDNPLGIELSARYISARILDPKTQWRDPPFLTLAEAVHKYSCRNSILDMQKLRAKLGVGGVY